MGIFLLHLLLLALMPDLLEASTHNANYDYLKPIDSEHPFCESPFNLHVAHEYFVELENELPGVKEYNDLCSHYRRQDWKRLEAEMQVFRRAKENSPLIEAASFLHVQSRFERMSEVGELELKENERRLRELLVLYPNSEWTAVMYANMGAFWLDRLTFDKSLGFFELGRKQFPFHSLSCIFHVGVAENFYQLRNFVASERTFKMVLQKCKNPRVRLGAELRLADLAVYRNRKHTKAYDKLFASDYGSLLQWYPTFLYNLGEIRYREKKYKNAKFFFEQYLNHNNLDHFCIPHALKRVADASFRLNEPIDKVIGRYLTVRERSPDSDIGRLSYIHALLLGLPVLAPPEQERRLKLIDEEADKIYDESLRSSAYLEKGLVLLDKGEKRSLNYLLRLSDRVPTALQDKVISSYIREKLLSLLEEEVGIKKKEVKKTPSEELSVRGDILKGIERAHTIWLKGTSHERRGKTLYGRLISEYFRRLLMEDKVGDAFAAFDGWVGSDIGPPKSILPKETRDAYEKILFDKFRALLEKKDLGGALSLLDRWCQSKWQPSINLAATKRDLVAGSLIREFVNSTDDSLPDLFLKHRETLGVFVHSPFTALWVGVAEQNKDLTELKRILMLASAPSLNSTKGPKSREVDLSPEMLSYIWYLMGRGYAAIKKDPEAQSALSKVGVPSLKQKTRLVQLDIHRRLGEYAQAYSVSAKTFQESKTEEKKPNLLSMLEQATLGKLWNRADTLLRTAEELGISGKDIAPFYHFTGQARFENSKCKDANAYFQRALLMDSENPRNLEARFKVGKCLTKLKQPAQAKQIWEELAALKDDFWSGLARNELSMLR